MIKPQKTVAINPTGKRFIANEGQYGDTLQYYGQMGNILFGYEGFEMPILFTKKGLIHLQRQIKSPTEKQKENLERKGIKEEVIAQQVTIINRVVVMEWLNSNPSVQIKAEDTATGYHTFGFIVKKIYAYQKITYSNLYPGIDLVYTFDHNDILGFRYSLIVHPNADITQVKLRFSGDIKSMHLDLKGNLILKSDLSGIKESAAISYYNDDTNNPTLDNNIKTVYALNEQVVSFAFPNGYDPKRSFVIDPFISSTTSLTGTNANKAKDIDFDYAGNVFVCGGGDNAIYKLAKFDSSGTLQWTFSGALTVPSWSYGTYYGGWVVDKTTGNTYLGQGFAPGGGFRIIRLNSSGTYDNYITTGSANFIENWKMLWSCNNGSPQIIIAGGGTNSNINLGICSPPSTIISGANITGIPYLGATGWAQDIADIIIDPVTNEMYTIYGSLFGTPTITNKIYKNSAPYTAASTIWNVASGFTSISEALNRPYLTPFTTLMDNSCNVLAINASYFFYWDGKNLKAYNKTTGAGVGTAISIAANTSLMQGGIIADECNNIYIGSANGIIKVYNFNGTTFNDSPPDITVSGFTTKAIYDLALSDAKKILYACGDGFVASLDVSAYGCSSNIYSLTVSSGCVNQTASATLSPTPPSNATVSYVLYSGTILVASNQTGVFTALTPNTSYTLHAFINQACSGIETVKTFTISGPAITFSQLNATCGNSNGSITALASGGTGILTFSIDGINFQSTGNFIGLTAGLYTVQVKDSLGCSSSISLYLANSNGPTFSTLKADAFCGTSNGSITITGANGIAPYSYSLNNGSFTSSNFFSGLAASIYLVTIKDSTGCTNQAYTTINNQGTATLSKVKLNATCGSNNGSITINATAGVAPYTFSNNGSTYQTNNVFNGLLPGNYTFYVKDSNNCITTTTDTILNATGPTLSNTVQSTSCTGTSGSITLIATGGTAPFQYSINGGSTYQSSALFSGLSAGTYQLIISDFNGCKTFSTAIVYQTLPQVTDTTTNASCTLHDGSITAVGTGGTPPYQYAINGATFQTSNIFPGLGTGTYTLTIKDSAGCSSSISPVIVNNASGLLLSGSSVSTSCAASTGRITLSGSGGLAPLQYSINGINYQSSGIFNALTAGTYSATVKDSNGCIATIMITVQSIAAPQVTATAISTSCNNPNGSVLVNATSGTKPYLYSINGITFQSSNAFLNLSVGTYTFTVKDSNLCTSTTSITITNIGSGTGPTVTATSISAECNQANGRIDANSSGGKNPKKHSIDGINFQGSGTFNNVPPGTYTVYVLDDNGCTNSCVITVGNIAGPGVTAIDSASVCGGSSGKIILTGLNGTAPYKFSLNGGGFQLSNVFSGLSAGYYTITVRDAANICNNSIVVKVSNSNGPILLLSKTDVSCATQNGKIIVAATGVGLLHYSINGINYQNNNEFIGLPAGQYAVYVKDSNGCTNTSTIAIGTIVLPQISATYTAETCGKANGMITATGSFGTLPYAYSIDDTTFQSSHIFTSLTAKNYTITIKDSNGCIAKTNVTLPSINGPQLSTTLFNPSCGHTNGTFLVTGRGGTMPYQFSIDGVHFQPSFMFTNLSEGTYFITLKDSNNCIVLDTVTLTNTAAFTLTVTEDTTGCGAGRASLVVNIIGGTGPFQYSIDSVTFQSSNRFYCLLAGSYHVIARDTMGCTNFYNKTLIGAVLDVSLLYFRAQEYPTTVDLEWVTTSEMNSDYFVVERSKDGLIWEALGVKNAAGNSLRTIHYALIDFQPFKTLSYYRLKQINLDGSFRYSSILTLHFDRPIELLIYPVPATTLVTIEWNKIAKPELEVTTVIGQRITIPFYREGTKIILNTSTLEDGIYYIHLRNGVKEMIGKFIILKNQNKGNK